MATNTVNSQEGHIWGLPVDALLNWTNVVYLVALAITVVASVAVWRLSALSGAAKDRQLATYQADAKVQIADAQKAASDAAKRAAEANERAASATERAAALEVEAGRLRLALDATASETARISQGLASRHLFDSQRALLASMLRDHAGSSVLVVSENSGDPETDGYTQEIAKALQAAGLLVTRQENTRYPPPTVNMVVDSPNQSGSAIAAALSAARIPFEYHQATVEAPIVRIGAKGPRF
jgi:hypothetical protein